MNDTTHADDARTDTKRFDSDADPFDVTDLIVGDRISPSLVASTMDGLGERRSADPDAGATQLAEATITNRMDDVHTAILVDGETGRMAVASRHDSQSAWSQKEADWKVRSHGDRVSVDEAEVERDPKDEWTDVDSVTESERWANVVLQERATGKMNYADEITLTGREWMSLHEAYDNVKIHAKFELEG